MADRVAQLLGALSLSATDRFRAGVDGSLGRGGAHSGALVHLDAYPGESVQELATVLGVSQPAAVKLADRHITERQLPDKAIDVIDEAASRTRLQAMTPPATIK